MLNILITNFEFKNQKSKPINWESKVLKIKTQTSCWLTTSSLRISSLIF